MRGFRFVQLLVSLLIFIVLIPILDQVGFGQWLVSRAVISMLFAVLVISAVLAVTENRKSFAYTVFAASVAILFQVVSLLYEQTWVLILASFFDVMFITFVVILLLRHLFTARDVTFETICASACTYILIGIGWAFLFTIMDLVNPQAFDFSAAMGPVTSLRFGAEEFATALYFSFVTLTTLGYGDITPQAMPARMLASVEALIGQLYLAILVARLVGVYTANQLHRQE